MARSAMEHLPKGEGLGILPIICLQNICIYCILSVILILHILYV